jgi:hypothetical protein
VGRKEEAAIRPKININYAFIFESPLLPPSSSDKTCHPERSEGSPRCFTKIYHIKPFQGLISESYANPQLTLGVIHIWLFQSHANKRCVQRVASKGGEMY